MKRCTGPCGETKSLEAFHRNRSKRDGRVSRCKACVAASYAARKAAGLCCACDAAADTGSVYCAQHLVAHNARSAALRTARRAAGLCHDCDAAADTGTVYCAEHRAAHTARQTARYAANPEKVNAAVAASNRKAYAAAVAERRCAWKSGRGCDQPADEGRTMCSTHCAEHAARTRLRRLKPVLRESVAGAASWEARDHWRCAYTGEPWDEVEHMVARNSSDGAKGSNDPGNLVPASRAINSAKTNRPYGDFLRDTYPHLFERGALSVVLNELYPAD